MVYTDLSPDIEYLHGHHLLYGIIALLCIVSIVIGLPLLLTFEPFLNRKFNFIKIKPLLVSRVLQRQVLLLCWLLHDL